MWRRTGASGNTGWPGGSSPAQAQAQAQALAADQRVTAWAQELNRAGLDGGTDALRARAFLEILAATYDGR